MNRICQLLSAAISAALLFSTTGCQNLPGQPSTQGAVIGGVGGAAAGAAIGGEKHQVMGALLGGALGAGAGYVVGANSDRIMNRDARGAAEATETAQTRPATAADARTATTADLNRDGFVTLDEVTAMSDAGFSDAEMIDRLQTTGQVFELTPEQERFLGSRGVSQRVISQMQNLNRQARDQFNNQPSSGVIGRPPGY